MRDESVHGQIISIPHLGAGKRESHLAANRKYRGYKEAIYKGSLAAVESTVPGITFTPETKTWTATVDTLNKDNKVERTTQTFLVKSEDEFPTLAFDRAIKWHPFYVMFLGKSRVAPTTKKPPKKPPPKMSTVG